ncbi:prostaglandin F2-alpha receptor-like [Lytechinus pictus]|uniref:prostaglandin F2-alpha receptor-like n=1 Tax=Lytechinus pictus TaxID=7653 RepID=UPI0030B9E1D1
MNGMNEDAPKNSFQDVEMRPTSAMTSGVITSTLSEYDVGNSTDIMVVTIAMRNSTLHSTSNASTTMDVSTMNLSTSGPYIPDEFVLPNRIFFAPLISLTLLIGIVANILAIVATRHAIRIYRTHRSRKVTIASYLIQCLMMVDLSAVVVFFVRGMFYNLYDDAYFKCDLNSVTNYFFSWAAGFVNAVMCFERCVALTAPFYYHSNATITKAKVGVIVVLLLAFITAMLPIFGFGSYKVLIAGTYYCIGPGDFTLDETGYDYHFGILFLVTGIGILIFIHTCNVIVITKIMEIRSRSLSLRRHKSKDANDGLSTKSARSTKEETSTFVNGTIETTSSSSMAGNNDAVNGEVGHRSPLRGGRRPRVKKPGKTEINVAKQIIVISIVFTISWLPFYVSNLDNFPKLHRTNLLIYQNI